MTEHGAAPTDQTDLVTLLQDRLRAMHVTLLFIAVLLCVVVGMNILLIAAD